MLNPPLRRWPDRLGARDVPAMGVAGGVPVTC